MKGGSKAQEDGVYISKSNLYLCWRNNFTTSVEKFWPLITSAYGIKMLHHDGNFRHVFCVYPPLSDFYKIPIFVPNLNVIKTTSNHWSRNYQPRYFTIPYIPSVSLKSSIFLCMSHWKIELFSETKGVIHIYVHENFLAISQ